MTLLDDLTFHEGEAADLLLDAIGRADRDPFVVVTVNVQHLAVAATDPSFGEVLRRADVRTADGAPVAWAAARRGRTTSRVTGSELVDVLVNRPPRPGLRIYLLGSDAATLQVAAARIVRSGGIVAGYEAPRRADLVDDERSRTIARRVAGSVPDAVLLFLGTPFQETWAERYRDELGPAVVIGAGGSLQFATGRTPRAPRLLQRLGLEWAFRLVREPRRLWRRYLIEYWPGLRLLGREVVRRPDRRRRR